MRRQRQLKCPVCSYTCSYSRTRLDHVWRCHIAGRWCWCDWKEGASYKSVSIAMFERHIRQHGGIENHLAECVLAHNENLTPFTLTGVRS